MRLVRLVRLWDRHNCDLRQVEVAKVGSLSHPSSIGRGRSSRMEGGFNARIWAATGNTLGAVHRAQQVVSCSSAGLAVVGVGLSASRW